ncbi:hypothetical protein EFT57_07825 [Lacticaseibacillus paracasei]|uniref:Uncharacterized protein n=1 Tax=Lacticaseibacillus paracasei (strain ATCC 334 / BCRC 17002 / CCUG 31169 / CIP 107868 / KCTC 3260 / NRRL B-441) TaxID=321967 RepID=Q035M5_LACP3|nr:hypothetical protein LSEI_2355 [Lacticaseibacillus paracasei ATCC 334]KAB1963891.1 hypothetical protein F8272_12480 [Lacticaseibacillus paracasei]MCT2892868.1 hypothetical protein [Lacticaseibacillus paracasei]MCT3333308.1 hypothetical protein [Lacticaseibacillus paracasei]MCT3351811.1 hypothetical protein [Lacticaseibacillus paracasei]
MRFYFLTLIKKVLKILTSQPPLFTEKCCFHRLKSRHHLQKTPCFSIDIFTEKANDKKQ